MIYIKVNAVYEGELEATFKFMQNEDIDFKEVELDELVLEASKGISEMEALSIVTENYSISEILETYDEHKEFLREIIETLSFEDTFRILVEETPDRSLPTQKKLIEMFKEER